MDINKKVVVITGGGRGLGAAMALRLAACGAKLALVDVDADNLMRAKAAIFSAAECATSTSLTSLGMIRLTRIPSAMNLQPL